ncbi:MAG: ParA family protein [Pseudomonadota bacterium]
MPVITFFQTKGGTGKTTSAFLLAEILSKSNTVTVIDADQNKPFQEWKNDGGRGEQFEIVTEPDAERVHEAIAEAAQRSAFVIVDTEGSANQTAARAAVMSDLVIVTSTGTPLDQKHAAKAIKFVRGAGKSAGRDISVRVLMTRQKAVGVSRTVKAAIANMQKHGISVFGCQLIERDAFSALFGYATLLFDLDPAKVNDPHRAYMNARVFVNQVLEALKEQQSPASKTSQEAA